MLRSTRALLIPWTILIAFVPSDRWFPSLFINLAWMAFDAALAVVLSNLARRWRRGLDTALAMLVSADTAVTTYQVFAWNLRHNPRNLATSIVAAISIIAPAMAAGLLWFGRRSGRESEACVGPRPERASTDV
jgi:hypothetical protein